MRSAVIVDAIRTPLGRRNGVLRTTHPVELAAVVLRALDERNGLDPSVVDDVVFGCVMQVGEQAVNVARNAVLAAGWPETVPGTTVDRQCASGQQATHFAAQGVIAGAYDVAVAGGVEVMSRVPMGSSMVDGRLGYPFGPGVGARYADVGGLVPPGMTAELVAERWNISRDDLDRYAVSSHERAVRAVTESRFERELIPVVGARGEVVTADEGIRPTTLEELAAFPPIFVPDRGRVTAGNSAPITDGAAALLVMSEERAAALGVRPRARFVEFALSGGDPRMMSTASVPATHEVLARAGLGLDEIDLIEVDEACASAVLAWQRDTGADLGRVNVNGGAISLGHPLGASGIRLMVTLLAELERIGGRFGLQTMGAGGGMATATIIERLP